MFSKLTCFLFALSPLLKSEPHESPKIQPTKLTFSYDVGSLFSIKSDYQLDENLEKEAQTLIKQQKYEEAIQIYQILLKRHSDNVDYLLKMGQLNVRLNRRKEAIFFYEKILKIDSNNQEAEISLAFAYLFDNNLEKSEYAFKKIIKNYPDNPDALAGIGYIALLKGNEVESEKFFNEALKHDPKHATSRIYLGNLRLRQRRIYEAKQIFEKLSTEDPNNPDVQQGLTDVSNAEKQIFEMELKRKLQPNSQTTHVTTSKKETQLFQEAQELRQQKRYNEAAEIYKKLLIDNPYNGDYLFTLGQLYLALNQNQDAIYFYERALTLYPERQEIRIALAYSYFFENKLNNSQLLFKVVLENEPRNVEALAGLGNIAIRNDQIENAENYLQKALQIEPKNITALLYLANLRTKKKRYHEAFEILNRAIELDPDRLDLKSALAYAYLLDKKPHLSKNLFKLILEKEPKNTEALAGMGRVAALENQPEEAESYYQLALEIDPNNVTALEFMAILKFKQKRYNEAAMIYSKLLTLNPQNKDYIEGLHDSNEVPLVEKARELRKNKNYSESSAILEYLVASSIEKIEYRLLLGSVYMDMKRKNEAINLYYEGLQIKPNDKDLLRALGFIYLNIALEEGNFRWTYYFPFILSKEKTNLYFSRDLFAAVLEQDPYDADALAGLGRIALAQGCVAQSEYLYNKSLNIDPKNTTTLSFLASLRSLQKKYFTAENTYLYLMQISPEDNEIRKNYKDFLNVRRPFVEVIGYYAEENEKNPLTEAWDARLKNYGGAINYVFPPADRLKLVANLSYDYIVLKDLINHNTIYSVHSPKPKVGFIWNQTPHLTISGGLCLAFYKQYQNSTFYTKSGQYYLPYLNALYIKDSLTCSIETIGDAPLVARDFASRQSDLIARQFINGFYEYDFGKRRLIGGSASYAWYYNRIKNNQFQSGSAWIQATPSCYWENLSFRYVFIYGRFSDLTVDYYTFRPQVAHWLKIDLIKKWCNDRIVTEAGFGHCWQRSFESGQIIQVTPVAVFHWVHREINAAYARLKLVFSDCVNATLTGTYSRDSFDYTTASITGNLHIRF
jgi:tetratricopeptide (TPR) repeat protein